ncbi:hypothetical protein WG66_014490 [Moniliophthora roreri]|uniref:F-box domain-containing protein n=1 Tax=Moniliophthora roreri TaxID=221103 RepID=A0A0W0FBV8_MONRR|nr:hypothetical protein WG66_014490 [Moniliophthora roreri]
MNTLQISSHGGSNPPPDAPSCIPSLRPQLRTNSVPALPFSAEEAQAQMRRNTRQLENLALALRALQAEQAALQRYVIECQSLFAPIRKLPVEILGSILSLVCTGGMGNTFGRKCILPSLCLSHVSHLWREIMTSRSDLWSTIDVRLDEMTKGSQRLLSLWLMRSRDAPLHVRALSGYWNSSSTSSSANEWKTFSLLLDHGHRWASAVLRLDFQLYVQASAKIVSMLEGDEADSDSGYESQQAAGKKVKPFSHLKTLDISWFDCRISAAHNQRPSIRLFLHAPALQSLTIHHYDDFFILPLSQIRSLTVTNVHQNPAPLLAQCTELKSLRLLNFASRDRTPHPPILMLHLTHFEVQISSYYESLTTKHLMDSLELPSLLSLTIAEPVHRYWDRPTWSHSAFIDMLSRSSCRLEKLAFIEVVVFPEELEETLQLNPTLTHATFIEWQCNDTTRSLMKTLSASLSLAPSLSQLSLRSDESLVNISEDLKGMISSRSRVKPLEQVLVESPETPADCMADLSSAVCSCGTKLIVRHEPTNFERVFPAYK